MMTLSRPAGSRYGLAVAASMALAAALAACPSRTRLDEGAIEALRARYQGQSFYLKQSLYHGRFYDDAHRRLVDARPFRELRLMTAPDGEIIVPPPPEGIVPVGTRVEVLDVEFPTSSAIFKRPLFTPRYNVWVVLRVGRIAGDASPFKPGEHILVLPTTVRGDEAIRASLDVLLSPQPLDDWLAQRSEAARLAIFEKRAEEGLTYEELIAAMGLPESIHRAYEGERRVEAARFGRTEVILTDDVVTAIREVSDEPSTPASAPAPAP